ncbi:MAG: cytidylate kinase family protein [Patescibacteria group bacterium]
MIITISGTPGSGKSTLGKMLAEKLGWARFYIGGVRREIARRHGITLEELNKLGETEAWTDKEVDDYIKELGVTRDNIIIEGRTAFFLIPNSIKLFVTVAPRVGATRVFSELQSDKISRNEGSNLDSIEAVEASHQARMKSDDTRYQKYYHKNIFDESQYDFILDTTNLTIAEGFSKLCSYLEDKIDPTK